MILEIITLLIANVLFIIGLQMTTWEGMILDESASDIKDYWIAKPIILCLRCMSSFWGAFFFISYCVAFEHKDVALLTFPYILILAGVMAIYTHLENYLNKP